MPYSRRGLVPSVRAVYSRFHRGGGYQKRSVLFVLYGRGLTGYACSKGSVMDSRQGAASAVFWFGKEIA